MNGTHTGSISKNVFYEIQKYTLRVIHSSYKVPEYLAKKK